MVVVSWVWLVHHTIVVLVKVEVPIIKPERRRVSVVRVS